MTENKTDSLVAAIEGNFAGMSHGDLVLTCEMLTRGRAEWRADAEKAAAELEALQRKYDDAFAGWKSYAERYTEANAANGENCKTIARQRQEIEALQKEVEQLRETLSINQEVFEIGLKWKRDSRLEEWFPITAEELASLRCTIAELQKDKGRLRNLLESCVKELERINNVQDGLPLVSQNLIYNARQELAMSAEKK